MLIKSTVCIRVHPLWYTVAWVSTNVQIFPSNMAAHRSVSLIQNHSVLHLFTNPDLFTVFIILPFPNNDIVAVLCLSDWHLSHGSVHLSFFHFELVNSFLLALNNIPVFRWTTVYLLIHLPERCPGYLQVWVIMIKVITPNAMHVLCGHVSN